MARNQITLAFANDSEISALGFVTREEAVLHYSEAAVTGFTQCRFVAGGLQDTIEGVLDEDYVVIITGIHNLVAKIGQFGDRPSNLRGWLLFSNCNYFLSALDLSFGGPGGEVVHVDNFMCGQNGTPVLAEAVWEFKDYFGELSEIELDGITYVKAWNVDRDEAPFKAQSLLAVRAITWLTDVPHALPDGTTRSVALPPKKNKSVVLDSCYTKLYDAIGAPFVGNGTKLTEVVKSPVYCHAQVKCICGVTSWTVGDWSGFKSPCCALTCKPTVLSFGVVTVGSVLFTSTAVSGGGIKYFGGLTLKYVDTLSGVHVWRVVKMQSVNGFVSNKPFDGTFYTATQLDVCSPYNKSVVALDVKFGLLSGTFTDTVKAAALAGDVVLSTKILDLTNLALAKPWFVRELQELIGTAWDVFVDCVRELGVLSTRLLELASSLAAASLTIMGDSIKLVANVPDCFRAAFETFCEFVSTAFDFSVNTVTIAGAKFKSVGAFALINNALVRFVSWDIRGLRQSGIKSALYANVVSGDTAKVTSKRIEHHAANLVIAEDAPLVKNGTTYIVGGRAFFYSGGVYRLMADADVVLLQPVFKAQQNFSVHFKCPKPDGFVDRVYESLSECVSDTAAQVTQFNTSYKVFDVNVKNGVCAVDVTYNFRAPAYIADKDAFVEACREHVNDESFDRFYADCHSCTHLASFVPINGFERFNCECPAVLQDIDNGVIWRSFLTTVSDVVSFVRSIKVTLDFGELKIVATKRFKKLAATLVNLYNQFMQSVASAIKVGGITLKHYAFSKPKVVFSNLVSSLHVVDAKDFSLPVQDGVSQVTVFDGVTPVLPTRVETAVVNFEEIDFVEPVDGGVVAVVDGYAFYNTGDLYYPSGCNSVLPVCYKRAGGLSVQFSETVSVHEVEPVFKVKLDFEFEDETLISVCKKVVGKYITVTGDWCALCEQLHAVMSVVAQHIDVPTYYIYDEEGGNDMCKLVMVSQWPLDDTTPDDQQVDEVDEQQQVAAEFAIADTPAQVVVDPFAFDFYDVAGVRVLRQDRNNCWVASALVQLQLLGVYDDDAFDLFRVGRVSHMVQKCYAGTGNIVGAMGDVSHCLEVLLKDLHTMFISLDVNCGCGKHTEELSGCVFRFMPTTNAFPYGACATCGDTKMFTITKLEGSGVFCQDPKPVDIGALLVAPLCAAVFKGSHYKTNIYTSNICVDGTSKCPIEWNTINTVCLKDVSYTTIAPFATYKSIEFYQGELSALMQLNFDFLVNAANENLSHGGGIAGAINAKSNGQLQRLSDEYIKQNGKLKVGTGVMLNCGFNVFNVVGPRKGRHATELLLKAYQSVFDNTGVPLTPLLSVGIFKVPLQDSLAALLASVGSRSVKCFCYTDVERDAIVTYINNVDNSIQVTEVEPVAPVFEPYRIEGKFAFYDVVPSAIMGFERVIFFTDELLNLSALAHTYDKHVNGALTSCVAAYLKENPRTPAGNLVTFKCEGALTITLAVLPGAEDVSFDKNVSRTINKLSKLKGDLLLEVPSATVFQRVLKVVTCAFWVSDETKCIVTDNFAPATVVVNVCKDGQDVHSVVVDTDKPLNEQLGPCTVDNVDMTGVLPDATVTKTVSVAPDLDWASFYGFPRADVWHTLDHSDYNFDTVCHDSIRVIKFSDNNCWVNATCIQLQIAKVVFKFQGLQNMWNDFCVGKVGPFVHWLYWLQNMKKGEPGDVENTFNIVARYMVNSGTVVLVRETADKCCSTTRRVTAAVVNASLLRVGCEDGHCVHGAQLYSRVQEVRGIAVLTSVAKPTVYLQSALLKGSSYTIFAGSIQDGHYTVFKDGGVYDGDRLTLNHNLSHYAATSMVVANTVSVDPVKVVEHKAESVLTTLDQAADKFFSIGDVVSKNCIMLLVWLFSILSLAVKAFRSKDYKVLALMPERTGIILSKSFKYNIKASCAFVKSKSRWLTLLLKTFGILFTMYVLWFFLLRFGPLNESLCRKYVDGYAESDFDKSAFCDSVNCKICLYGYDELADFPHTQTVWEHLRDPVFKRVLPILYLSFLMLFGGAIVKACMLYFVAQYVNLLGVACGLHDTVWVLQVLPFDIFGDEIVVLFLVVKSLLFLRHVFLGCDKPSCVACTRSARLTRVPLQTIVNGSSKSFYVVANGGKKFCSKHNFFCRNCDSFGPGNTFINDVVAAEVSSVVKTSVQPTAPATIDVDKVEFQNGFYYLYSGETFWKYNFDITESKYSCKDVLKNCNLLTDFVVYNNSGSNVTQVKNACVYFSQLLCKPIKLVDSALLASLNVDFNGALHSAFVEVLQNSFGKDLSSCASMAECKTALDLDVNDEDFVNSVSNAHRFNVHLTDIAYNNFVTSYAKPEEKLSTHDIATCMRGSAKVVNHNVLVKENVPIVWLASDFNMLSEEGRRYVVKTAKLKGVTFMLTFNANRMQTSVPAISVVAKKGSGVKVCYNWLWWLCLVLIGAFMALGFVNFTTNVDSQEAYGYKYISGGKLYNFEAPLDCVYNVFNGFADWHMSAFGSVPRFSRQCPIVVGVADDVRLVPGVPTGVKLVGKTLVFAVKTVFADSGTCYDITGPAHESQCVFNAACTVLKGLGGLVTYCYKHGLVEGARLYTELQPHSHYVTSDGGYVKLPEVLASGFGFRTVKTLETTYCRMGQCVDSKKGVCFGANRFLVYSAESGSDFVCGTGLLSLFYNLLTAFSASFSVMALSGQIVFNCAVACLAIFICLLVTKFKRMFGDLSFGVCTVICAVVVNNVSYFFTQNAVFMVVYAVLYFLCTRTFKYNWIWHLGYCVAYVMLAPWWLVFWYVASALIGVVPNILKLKVTTQLFDGDRFVGTFESAASGTFVMDMHSYQRLVNSVSPEKLKQYAATYNKYKYYSGSASEADYRLACYAHLAKAMMDYGLNHNDILYTPPTISYNSTLQGGLRKMAQPSGLVEKCIARVCYGNVVLNGIWLGDVVICPRHVIASNTNAVIDYEHDYSVMRLHNFSVSVGNVFLGVVGVTMKGVNLHIKVNQSNVHTPPYSFKTLKQGDSFNILACYDGCPTGVYGVTLRNNNTIKGSFINGACGSPGYNMNGGKVEFCYLHQLELGSGCHVGSNFDGAMYGNFEDQPTLQVEGVEQLVTVNVLAFLYGALLNGVTWFLSPDKVTVDNFNEWAQLNGFTTCVNVDCFAILAAKTGVDVPRLLASIQHLSKGFGGRNILGFTSLTDEFTVAEVVRQMYGVNLQSSKPKGWFRNVTITFGFLSVFWSELLHFTPFFWINPGFITPAFLILLVISFALMCAIKHKILFLHTFLLPAVFVTSCYNFAWEWYITKALVEVFEYHVSLFSFDMQSVFTVLSCIFVSLLHTKRFYTSNASFVTYALSIVCVISGAIFGMDYLSSAMMVLFNFTFSWYIGATVYKVAALAVTFTSLPMFIGHVKAVMLLYVVVGYFCCTYYGFLYWINRFCKLNLGVYDFKVSANEFKYMVANGLQAPRGVFDSLALSIKLIGIGGDKTIKVSSVQSKLTDIKCTNVVLLGCLSSMNISSNTKEWAYCVELHNKINLCDDPEAAQEMLLALLAFFLSKQKDFGMDDLLDSYFATGSMLQSVASTFVNMPSFVAYENARQAYEEAVNSGAAATLIKQLKRAMNVAKAEFDHEASVQRKISRMAEQAAAQMYKDARAVNRKSKVISAMHSLLFGMLRRLDMSSVDTILSLARDGVVPLSIIPAACATKLNVVSADLESYLKICKEGCVHYAGVVWSVVDIRDNDGKVVHMKEITADNKENLAWPLFLNCDRIVKLQNNEIMPGKLKQRVVRAEGDGFSSEGKALYNNESGKTFMYAFVADKPDLKFVKWEFDGGCNTIELEPPCKFAVDTANGVVIKYLYFVRNLNTLRRGAVLGFIGATVRLQAGKQTELVANSSLLTMCAFSVDPAKTYLDAVKKGVKPVGNCVKMLANGSGNGQAITVGVEANTNQDSYGGASVCLYCRAYVEHPGIDGRCSLKGKYVQVPLGTPDPIRFCLENEPCKVCMCWLNNGCTCDRVTVQSMDMGYLNEHGALVQLN